MIKKKTLYIFTLITILINVISVFAQPKLPDPTTEFYVADYAGVLTQDVEDIIISVNKNYEKTKESPQVVVATVPNMQGMDEVGYGVELFEKWKIGNKEYDNGVLLLLSMEERRVRIEVGYGLEGAITDSKAGDILDNALPQLSEGNYSEGLLNVFYQIVQEVNGEYGYDDSAIMERFQEYNFTPNTNTSTPLFTVNRVIIAILVMFLIWFDSRFLGGFIFRTLMWMIFFGRGGGRGGGGGFGGGSFGGGGSSGGGGADRGF